MSLQKKVLIAESYDVTRNFLKEKLLKKGYRVEVVSNGEEVFSKIDDFLPDVLLLDTIMPVISGLEILKRIKENEKTKNISVILSSNMGESEEIDFAMSLGAEDYFTKIDFDPQEVVNKIRRSFKRKALELKMKEEKNREALENQISEEDFRTFSEEEQSEEFQVENEGNIKENLKERSEKEDETMEKEAVQKVSEDTIVKKDEEESENDEKIGEDTKETVEDNKEELEKDKKIAKEEVLKNEKKQSFFQKNRRHLVFFLPIIILLSAIFFILNMFNKTDEVIVTYNEEEKCLRDGMYWHEEDCYEDFETFTFLNNIIKEKECLRDDMYWHEEDCYEDFETFTFLNNIIKEKECLRDGMHWEDGECYEILE
jgi:DNA-binding response OmpR family regulator